MKSISHFDEYKLIFRLPRQSFDWHVDFIGKHTVYRHERRHSVTTLHMTLGSSWTLITKMTWRCRMGGGGSHLYLVLPSLSRHIRLGIHVLASSEDPNTLLAAVFSSRLVRLSVKVRFYTEENGMCYYIWIWNIAQKLTVKHIFEGEAWGFSKSCFLLRFSFAADLHRIKLTMGPDLPPQPPHPNLPTLIVKVSFIASCHLLPLGGGQSPPRICL